MGALACDCCAQFSKGEKMIKRIVLGLMLTLAVMQLNGCCCTYIKKLNENWCGWCRG
jgi:hypothetical protein